MKFKKKILCYILSFLLVFSVLPIRTLASNINVGQPKMQSTTLDCYSESDKKIIGEIQGKREANIKHFYMEDGSYQAMVYPYNVHYMKNGIWQDIDNTLKDSTDENGQEVLENSKNSFKVKISKNTNSNNLVKIQKDNYEISWNLEGINKAKCEPVILDTEKEEGMINNDVENTISSEFSDKTQEEKDKIRNILCSNKKITTLTNTESKVKITDAFPGVDIYYDIIGDSIKENFIINKPIDNPIFKINLNTKNLVPKLDDSGIITFYDKDKMVFQIKAPFLYDSAGVDSRNIVQKLEKQKNSYILTMELDKEWLNDSERSYPITLDPSVETSSVRQDIKDAFVCSGLPTSNSQNAVLLGVGYGSSSKTTRSYIKFTLPSLSTGDMVTNARLYLYLYTSNSTPHQINIHKVNADWNSGTITWNNMPAYNGNIEDYDIVSGNTNAQFNWNITGIVRQWYTTGNNYGLMLKSNNESSGYNEFYSSDCSSAYAYARPSAAIYYINNSGLESYWTYHSQDVGRAGTGYVNDYNGNLIFTHDDSSLNGNRVPVSISHAYNSNDRTVNIGYGLGWRLNYSQKVTPKTYSDGQHYLYTDEDGTVHDFKSVSGIYKDQSGLDLTLTKNGDSTYTITDKKSNKLNFTSSGYLSTIKDNNGNTMIFGYSGTMLKTITDGAGRKFTLDTLTDGKLSAINDPSGRKTSYVYTGNQLTKITYPDGKYTTYTYDSDNKLLSATNYDGYRITYEYYTAAPYRISRITESNSDGTSGQDLKLNYGNNVTIFTDYRGGKNLYNFNYWGNTLGIKDNDGYAEYYKYGSDSNTNKLTIQSKLQKTVTNYLLNHDVEASGNWIFCNDSVSTASGQFTTSYSYIGQQSLKVLKTNTGSRSYYEQRLTLEKGKTYTYSGYIKTEGISSSNGQGAHLLLHYKNNTGAWREIHSSYVSGTNDWNRYEITFTIPSDASSGDVIMRTAILGETGTAYFDCLQLEDGTIANRYNILENSDLKYGSDLPTFWSKNAYCSSSDILTTTSDSNHPTTLNNNVFKMIGLYGKNKRLSQTINVSGKAGDTFVYSGWAQGSSVPLGDTRKFSLGLQINYTDGTAKYNEVTFSPDSSDWQYISDVASADKNYSSIIFHCIYYQNANTAYFDGLQLYKEEFGQSYTYDSKGNVISTADLAKQNSTFEYSSNNDLIKSTDPKGNNFNYSYDSKHNILNATSAENVVYSFTYDSNGNPLTSKIGGSTLFINSSASYTSNGNYIKTVTDASGNTVTYNTDETKGNLTSLTDAKGKTTNYTYDPNTDNLTSVSKAAGGNNITNSYSYVNDRINTITQNGFNYSFGYDKLGNNTTVNVGSKNLITNQYEDRSSRLLKSTYGNGQAVSIDYDSEDRITAKKVQGDNSVHVNYQGYVQGIGWQSLVSDNAICGTVGQGLRLEAIKISLSNQIPGMSIKYQVHVQSIGWMDWVSDGQLAGTTGQNLRIEAIRIQLQGAPEGYRIQYQAHVQSVGWMDPVKDGEIAGTVGRSLRLEAIRINIDKYRYGYEYNASGNLGYINDVENGVKYNYTYDLADRLVKVTGSNGSSYGFSYDANNNSNKVDEKIGGNSFSTSFTYDKDNKLKEVLFGGNKKLTNTYDAIGRLTGK